MNIIPLDTIDLRDPMHFFFLLDASASMGGGRIRALNEAMREALAVIPGICDEKDMLPVIHALAIRDDAQWLCGATASEGVPVPGAAWEDLSASGTADVARAISGMLEGLSIRHLGHRAPRPIIILVTAGADRDPAATSGAISQLIARQKSLRAAFGMGACDPGALEAFASSGDLCITVEDPAELPGAMCSAIRRILTTYYPKPFSPTPPCSTTTIDDHEWI